MNKKGLTLVELLAVIGILSILVVVVIVNVANYVGQANDTSFETLVRSIEESTELYLADHSQEYPQLEEVGSVFQIDLNVLVVDNYIRSKLIDERTGEIIPLDTKIAITVIDSDSIDVELKY